MAHRIHRRSLPIAKACSKLQSQYTSNPSSVAQKAAEAAYLRPQDCVEEMRKAFERRRDLVVSLAREIPGLKVSCPQAPSISSLKCRHISARASTARPSPPTPIWPCTCSKRDTWPQWPDRPSASRDTYALAMRLPTITSVKPCAA